MHLFGQHQNVLSTTHIARNNKIEGKNETFCLFELNSDQK